MSPYRNDEVEQPSVLIDCQNTNGENLLWHVQHHCLYWTDIPEGKLFRYRLGDSSPEQIYSGASVGGFTIQADGALLLFKTHGTVEIWREGETTLIIDEIPEAKGTRFNDAIADPKGRVFSGTMATETIPGNLYRIERDGSYQVVLKDLLIPNGMAFSKDYRHLYITDSTRRVIYRFDYDIESGDISNQHVHIVTPVDEGVPDGMTMDAAGYLWSARWGGSGVYRYDSLGNPVQKVSVPVEKVSCVTMGGENCDQMFISTAIGGSRIAKPGTSDFDSLAGAIFSLKSSTQGRPELLSRVGI